jgi:hypothetical protein
MRIRHLKVDQLAEFDDLGEVSPIQAICPSAAGKYEISTLLFVMVLAQW